MDPTTEQVTIIDEPNSKWQITIRREGDGVVLNQSDFKALLDLIRSLQAEIKKQKVRDRALAEEWLYGANY